MKKEEILKSCEEFDKSLESGGFKWEKLYHYGYQVSEDGKDDLAKVYISIYWYPDNDNNSAVWLLDSHRYGFDYFPIGDMSAKDATASAIALCLGNAKRHLKNLTSVVEKAPHVEISNDLRKVLK